MHKDSLGEVIYVGKAINLRNRVRSYFRKTSQADPKVRALVSNIAEFEYITCATEMEALVLECNLIKKFMPKYNILLKDGKSYPYIEVTKPLIVVTGPGGGSGKLATSLSQVYHEYSRGRKARYAKFETFPIWSLPLKHPVNIAYEAATADLKDVNMIDSFHLEAYGETAVNYNRDLEVFPVLKRIIEKITVDRNYHITMTFFITEDDFREKAMESASKLEIVEAEDGIWRPRRTHAG